MKKEYYKRFYIKDVYFATQEVEIEAMMNTLIENWVNSYPSDPQYRIINAETQIIEATTWAGQTLPPTIRYVVHIAYTL